MSKINKALEILKEQFARGEISEEEFLRKRKLIEE
ncbi:MULTISPECIES: SHOCT domain-containing protein [unclassified Marinitoga]|nr:MULTISPECIES: SHOCT domain-containing protein [unclassified Marinitoga]